MIWQIIIYYTYQFISFIFKFNYYVIGKLQIFFNRAISVFKLAILFLLCIRKDI